MKINTKKIGAALLGMALCASVAAIAVQKASANEGEGNKENKSNFGMNFAAKIGAKLGIFKDKDDSSKDAAAQSQISIGANGKVLVRGAKVTSISGDTITAQVAWGSYVSTWKVDASDAKFLRHFGGASALAEIAVGHTISFTGALDTEESSATVKADFVKDWSVDRQDAPRTGTLQGELKAIGGTSAPTDLTVKVKDEDYDVNISASTAILNKNWGTLSLGSFEVGDTVRFYGSIEGQVSNATVVRNISR